MPASTILTTEGTKTKEGVLASWLRLVPMILGVVLLSAAFLKGWELATEELTENSVFTTRWFLAPLVLFELGLGVWLISGLHARGTRWLLLFTFVVFFESALYLALSGYHTCQCLGRTIVSPWIAAGFDAAAILAVFLWQPAANGPSVFSHRGRFALVCIVYALAAFPALLNMVNYTPTGQMPRLRSDPELAARVKVEFKEATAQQLFDQLHAATGLHFSVDDRLAQSWPPNFGEIKLTGVPAWAVMELLVHKQPVAARWQKEEGGYRLVPSAPWGTRTPWILSGAALLVAGVCLVFFRSRGGPDAGGVA